jgi:cell envelope opacity-associated protein A
VSQPTPPNSLLELAIHYDSTARVDVSGQLYPLSNLERGDVIDVTLEPNGSSNYLAQRITLVRNVRQ